MVIEQLLKDLDARWRMDSANKIPLHVIGSAALMLQASYERGTKDSDVLQTGDITDEIRDELLSLAGKGTALHRKHHMYIDVVLEAIPFLPQQPLWHPLDELNPALRNFEVSALDIVDVVVSKLKRFSPNDRHDIDAMVERDLVDHGRLLERFRAAIDFNSMDSRADDFPRYVENLHRVERDFFGVEETEVELPGWV